MTGLDAERVIPAAEVTPPGEVTPAAEATPPGVALRARLGRRLAIYKQPLFVGVSILGVIITVWLYVVGSQTPTARVGFDSYAYWAVDPFRPYQIPLGELGSYTYSPAIALLFAPAHLLPFGAFYVLWAGFLTATLVWLCRRYTLVWLAFLPIPLELFHANVHLVIALACVLGFRYPAVWSVVLLTKVTPGIGLLWFVVRREWRSLAIALGATAAIVAVSFVVAPQAWVDWVRFLASSNGTGPVENNKAYLAVIPPLAVRLVAAALIVTWGALTDRRWTVPVAATVALPVPWIIGPAILAAMPRLMARASSRPAPVATAEAPAPPVSIAEAPAPADVPALSAAPTHTP